MTESIPTLVHSAVLARAAEAHEAALRTLARRAFTDAELAAMEAASDGVEARRDVSKPAVVERWVAACRPIVRADPWRGPVDCAAWWYPAA